MTRLIFLDPVVLGGCVFPNPTSGEPFDSDACNAFKDLMNRVDDVAIILLATYSPTLEKLKEIWELHGLPGDKIVQIIEERGGIFFPTHSVHNWLRGPRKSADSFVIIDRMPREDSYPSHLVVVKDRLSSEHVETILDILHTPFTQWDVKRGYLPPVRARGDECVCC